MVVIGLGAIPGPLFCGQCGVLLLLGALCGALGALSYVLLTLCRVGSGLCAAALPWLYSSLLGLVGFGGLSFFCRALPVG